MGEHTFGWLKRRARLVLVVAMVAVMVAVVPAASATPAQDGPPSLQTVGGNSAGAVFAPDTDDAYVTQWIQQQGSARPPEANIFSHWNPAQTALNNGGGNQGDSLELTWSVIPDGTLMPADGANDTTCNSNLIATFNSVYGAGNWQAEMQNVWNDWTGTSGNVYTPAVALDANGTPIDDGAAWPSSGGVANVRGDIRIGGCAIDGNSKTLAYNYFPGTFGQGDMKIESTDSFYSGNPLTPHFHNVFSHEHGHGSGLAHVCPTDNTKLMEPFINTNFTGLQHDDIRGTQRNYGDRFELIDNSNDSQAAATSLGSFVGATSEDTLSIDHSAEQDWFTFHANVNDVVNVVVQPVGFTYLEGNQVFNSGTGQYVCEPGTPLNSLNQLDLRVDVWGPNGFVSTVDDTGAGLAEGFDLNVGAPDGPFWLRVYSLDTGDIQLYDLSLDRTLTTSAPANDNFANAYTLSGTSDVDYSSNRLATTETGEPEPELSSCVGGSELSHSVWWKWTAPYSADVTIDTAGSSFDTVLAAYTGGAVNALTEVACNDDGLPSQLSTVTFPAIGGTTYRIQVDGFGTRQGDLTVNLEQAPDPCGSGPWSATDTASLNVAIGCFNAVTAPGGYVIDIDSSITLGAASATIDNASAGVSLTVDGNGNTVDASGGAFRVFEVAADTEVAFDAITVTGANSSTGSGGGIMNAGSVTVSNSTISGNTTTGQGGGIFSSGSLVVSGSTISGNTASFGGGVSVNGGAAAFLEMQNSTVSGNAATGNTGGIINAAGTVTVAYSTITDNTSPFTGGVGTEQATGVSNIAASIVAGNNGSDLANQLGGTYGSGGFNVIGSVNGSFSGLVSDVTGAAPLLDPLGINAGGSTRTHALQVGSPALDRVTGAPGFGVDETVDQNGTVRPQGSAKDAGSFESLPLAPPNDDFANAFVLSGATDTATGTNVNATTETGEPEPALGTCTAGPYNTNSVWWTWTAPGDGTVTMDMTGSSFDAVLAVYTGAAVNALTEVACDDATTVALDSVTFPVTSGTVYRIQIDGWSNNTGAITVNVNFAPPAALCNGLAVTVDLNLGQTPTTGDDVILGTPGDDLIVADAGNDTVCGEGGNDAIAGNEGNDTIFGGPGDDTIYGSAGDDDIRGEDGADIIQGNDGIDTIRGGVGNDQLSGNNDGDFLFGNDDNDTLYGVAGDDVIEGGPGNDTVLGGLGNDTISGQGDDDLISGNDGADTIFGGAGNDTLYGVTGADNLNGDAGTDAILGGLGNDIIDGGDDPDNLSGNEDNDTITGGGGDDNIYGVDGNDNLDGQGGNDTILGGNGLDAINGGTGNDLLSGNAGDDSVSGNDGDDTIYGVDGNDTLNGGSGLDIILGGNNNDTINSLDGQIDQVSGNAGTDTCTRDNGPVFDNVFACEILLP